MFFVYGDRTANCIFERCNGGEFTIIYSEAVLKSVIQDFINKDKKDQEILLNRKFPKRVFRTQKRPDGTSIGFWA